MHQDGPSAFDKTGGRAVAYFHDILTLTPHTNNRKTLTKTAREYQKDQPTTTRSSSTRLAVNTSPGVSG